MDSIGDRDRGSVGHGGMRNGSNRMFQPVLAVSQLSAVSCPAFSALLGREGKKGGCVHVCDVCKRII